MEGRPGVAAVGQLQRDGRGGESDEFQGVRVGQLVADHRGVEHEVSRMGPGICSQAPGPKATVSINRGALSSCRPCPISSSVAPIDAARSSRSARAADEAPSSTENNSGSRALTERAISGVSAAIRRAIDAPVSCPPRPQARPRPRPLSLTKSSTSSNVRRSLIASRDRSHSAMTPLASVRASGALLQEI